MKKTTEEEKEKLTISPFEKGREPRETAWSTALCCSRRGGGNVCREKSL